MVLAALSAPIKSFSVRALCAVCLLITILCFHGEMMNELAHEIVPIKQVSEEGNICSCDWTQLHNSGEKLRIRSSIFTRKSMQKGTASFPKLALGKRNP